MARKPIRWYLIILPLTLMLAGCPDSDDDNGVDIGADEPGPEAFSNPVRLIADSTALSTGGSDTVAITAIVRDENSITAAAEDINFRAALDDDVIITQPPEERITDGSGRVQVDVTAGADPRNREARIIADTRFGSGSITLEVAGTSVDLRAPDTIAIGQDAEVEIRVTDGSGEAVRNERVNISLSGGLTIDEEFDNRTNDSGIVRGRVSAQATNEEEGNISVSVPGLDLATAKSVQIPAERLSFRFPDEETALPVDVEHEIGTFWERDGAPESGGLVEYTVSRGQPEDGGETTTDGAGEATFDISSPISGPVRVEIKGTTAAGTQIRESRDFNYVGTEPAEIEVITNPTVVELGGETTILAQVMDADGNRVADQTVNFSIERDDSGGSSLNSTQAQTDLSGIARVGLTGGLNESGPEGVVVRAAIVREDAPTISATEPLTVTADAFSISLGTGSEILEPDEASYESPWKVIVTDSTGSPVRDQDVEIMVTPIAYRKGIWVQVPNGWIAAQDPGTESTDEPEFLLPPRVCISRDIDPFDPIFPDGPDRLFRDAQQGVTQPTGVAAAPDDLTTNQDGQADFSLVYPQSEAIWVIIRVEASVQTDNFTQRKRSRAMVLPILADDVDDPDEAPPGGTIGAYGTNPDCEIPG